MNFDGALKAELQYEEFLDDFLPRAIAMSVGTFSRPRGARPPRRKRGEHHYQNESRLCKELLVLSVLIVARREGLAMTLQGFAGRDSAAVSNYQFRSWRREVSREEIAYVRRHQRLPERFVITSAIPRRLWDQYRWQIGHMSGRPGVSTRRLPTPN